MQKLQAKLKNVPRNASQVPCSTNLLLNREETLSATDIVLTCNNPEVNQAAKADALPLKSEILWCGCKPHKILKKRLTSTTLKRL